MEKDDKTYFVLRVRGYVDEFDTEKEARAELVLYDMDEPFELTKVVAKVLDSRA